MLKVHENIIDAMK